MSSSWYFESLKKSIGNICAQACAQSSKHISIPGSISVYPWAWFTSSGFQPKIRYQLLSVSHGLVAARNTGLWMHFVQIGVMSSSQTNKRPLMLTSTLHHHFIAAQYQLMRNFVLMSFKYFLILFSCFLGHWDAISRIYPPCSEANQKT